MAKRGIILIILLIVFSSIAYSQISRDITKIRCGDGVLDEFEMCEKDIESDKCDKMGEILKIDTACFDRECVCVPFVKSAFCKNDIREGAEMCDGTAEDFCPAFGEAIGLNLTCDPETCLCKITTGVPSTYDPTYNETQEEEPEGMAVCGDGKLQLAEECDPPNTLCTLESGEVGVCAEGCKCVETESIGIDDKEDEELEEENKTEEIEDAEETEQEEPEEAEETAEMTEVEKKGFFVRLLEWVKDLFS